MHDLQSLKGKALKAVRVKGEEARDTFLSLKQRIGYVVISYSSARIAQKIGFTGVSPWESDPSLEVFKHVRALKVVFYFL